MMWGCIYVGGRSDLVVMERGSDSRRNGFTQNSYLKVLKDYFLPLYDEMRDFQQDNVRIHTVKRVTNWFLNHGVSLLEWPTHSPDLNLIEHI